MNLEFEWDDTKAAENLRIHAVSFAQAALAFRDPFAVEWLDLWEAYGEERIILLGMTSNQVLTVVYRAYVSRMPLSKKGGEIALFLLYHIRQED
jgi:uncharacterized DUF497 family protein